MKVLGASFGGTLAEEGSQGWVRGWRGEEAVEESMGVEAGASGEDRECVALGERGENEACMAGVVAGGAGFVGVVEIEQVVWDEESFGGRGFGGAELHVAVDSDRVAGEDLGVEVLGEGERERGLAGGGGAEEGYERAHEASDRLQGIFAS